MNRPPVRFPLRAIGVAPVWRWLKWLLVAAFLRALAIAARLVQIEIGTSRLQARYLSELGRDIAFTVDDGASNSIRFPASGPYDVRLGYASLPSFEQRLTARGFAVASQARDSARMASLADGGLFLPYAEKDQAGLLLHDASGTLLFSARYPNRVYDSFDAIPPLVVDTLLFIEDRYLLDPDQPTRNPAIDWGRFSRALFDQGMRVIDRHQPTPGGSTLATQTEKCRHPPGGRPATPPEKLRQIASASVRAYLGGPQTLPARRQIVVRYLNSVPLAAQPGGGEISGIDDGLAAWYGRDFDEVNRILNAPASGESLDAQALAFKQQALSLMIAQRAPSRFLRSGSMELDRLTDSYLRLLAANGIISMSLRDAALAVPLELNRTPPVRPPVSFVTRKAVTALRAHLLTTLGVSSFYDLDRLDLTATATLDNRVHQAATESPANAA